MDAAFIAILAMIFVGGVIGGWLAHWLYVRNIEYQYEAEYKKLRLERKWPMAV